MKGLPLLKIAVVFALPLFVHAQIGIDMSGEISRSMKSKVKIIVLPAIDSFSRYSMKSHLAPNRYIIDTRQMLFHNIPARTASRIDTLDLTAAERAYIDSSIDALQNFYWTKQALQNLDLTHFMLVNKNKTATIKPRRKKLLYTMMPPIYIRGNSLCFFFYKYACGPLCGYGDVSIWKKENDKWVYWWNITFWQA